ncbi:MAG TPA: helix-turn-helix domain-containing protein [Candidatus Pelethenecus sp.]|nr:helix-turn-helix domain-containing protein [Candidatus Pelethenecus sp.]
MAQGKKYNDDVKEKAFALLACNNNTQAVAEELGIPYTTVKTWEKKWINNGAHKQEETPEKPITKHGEDNLVELRNKKKEEFVENAWELIGKVRTLLERRLDRAILSENIIDEIVEEITKLDSKQLTDSQRKALYSKISAIKIENVKELATVLGTLYDKQALANKEATAIVEGDIKVKKFEDF